MGPAIRGMAGRAAPVRADRLACRVPGNDGRVFAAGDAAPYPIKHGGVGAQMADTAAAAIAGSPGPMLSQRRFSR